MSLEAEGLKTAPPGGPTARTERPPSTFDRIIRLGASLLLLAVLTVVYWIPMGLLGGFASAIVLAAVTMLGAGLASRLYHLRVRVQALEAVLHDRDKPPPQSPAAPLTPPAAPTPEERHAQNRLEEVQKEP